MAYRTPKPLEILVTEPELLAVPEIAALAAKGHRVSALEQPCDVVLGRKAWQFDLKFHLKLLTDIVADGWARVYGEKKS